MIVTTSMVLVWAAQAGVQEVIKTSIGKVVSTNWAKRLLKGKTIAEQLSQQENYELYLEKHLYASMKMRTIHSADKDVLLDQIYHPLTITDRENSLLIQDGFVHENNEITNIVGYAGQGKSTILRKIFLESLIYGNKIPFFMELRRIESDGVVKSLISILDQLRITAEQDDVESLLESGNVLLLLDGFDEVKTEYRSQLLKEIFHLNKKYNTQIIITSRHDTEICREAGVSNFYVEHIKQADIIAVIEKLDRYQKTDVKDYFNISEILENNQSLVETINTPLLATLFYVCYPHLDSIPENAIDFYDRLFVTLYLHHDKSKNFVREKKANLDKNQAYQCFCALCFKSIYESQFEFTELSILQYIKDIACRVDIENISAEQIFDDFINITCLIQKDGYDHIVFLHKSIQEFHAARYILSTSTSKKLVILKKIRQKIYEMSVSLYPVIKYLEHYSKQDVIENILIPLCEDVGFDEYEMNKEILLQKYYDYIGDLCIYIRYEPKQQSTDFKISIGHISWTRPNTKRDNLLEILFNLSNFLFYNQSMLGTDFDSELISNIYYLFNNLLKSHAQFYQSICNKMGLHHDSFPIKFEELIPYLDDSQKVDFFKQIENKIDQLYKNTYVQYSKQMKKEKDDITDWLD